MTPVPCIETVVGKLLQALFKRLDENGVGSCAPEDGKRMERCLALQHVHKATTPMSRTFCRILLVEKRRQMPLC